MKTKTKIGVDFDKIFVNYPPVIPGSIIEYLYKKKNHKLKYRIPGFFERKIRVLSHSLFLRPPITENIEALKKIYDKKEFSIYLISSRFSFLKKKTEIWNNKHKISKYFEHMYFNFGDIQPHIFKDEIIKKEGIKKFIDDDLDLLKYLSDKNPNVDFFWVSPKNTKENLPNNIRRVGDLNSILDKYL